MRPPACADSGHSHGIAREAEANHIRAAPRVGIARAEEARQKLRQSRSDADEKRPEEDNPSVQVHWSGVHLASAIWFAQIRRDPHQLSVTV